MDNSSQGNKRALKVIIIEVAVVVIIIAALLFVFKLIPFKNTSPIKSADALPVSPNSPNVVFATAIFSIQGTVKRVTPNPPPPPNNTYTIVLQEFPDQQFTYGSSTFLRRQTQGKIPVSEVKTGDKVFVGGSYDLKNKKWYFAAPSSQNTKNK